MDIDTIISAISTCASAIMIGDKIVSALEKHNMITPEHIRTISETPYAMIFKVLLFLHLIQLFLQSKNNLFKKKYYKLYL